MIKTISKMAIPIAMLACVAMASGQGGGQGRGGRGQGRGFGNSPLSLAVRSDVQKDLAVTDDQKKKLDELQTKMREAMRGLGGGRRGGRRGGVDATGSGSTGTTGSGTAAGGGTGAGAGSSGAGGSASGVTFDRDAFQKRMEDMRAQNKKDLAAILTPGQLKRLDEIALQLRGNRALMDKDTQKTVGITPDQIKKIDELNTKLQEANRSVMEKSRNQEITREQAQETRDKNNKALDDEIAKLITPAQSAKLKELQGKPFKADPSQRRGG